MSFHIGLATSGAGGMQPNAFVLDHIPDNDCVCREFSSHQNGN